MFKLSRVLLTRIQSNKCKKFFPQQQKILFSVRKTNCMVKHEINTASYAFTPMSNKEIFPK